MMMRSNLLLHLIMPLISVAAIIMNVNLCSAVDHVVGDDRGWAFHQDIHRWVSGKIFHVGDNLWFAYASGEQSVVELKSKEEWEACDLSNPVRLHTGGIDSIPLTHVGTRYLSSGKVEDCQNGMKLHINVNGAHSSSESTSDNGILCNIIRSRENLQKIRDWTLSWLAIEKISTLMGGVKSVAEAPTSGSAPTFSTHSLFSCAFLSFLLLLH